MPSCKTASAVLLFIGLVIGTACSAQMSTDRINQIPDIMQVDPDGNFKRFGAEYCGPAAVSNSLVWLAHNGFPNLIKYTGNDKADQFDVVRTLATAEYIGTDDAKGSTPNRVLNGLKKYVNERGYKFQKLEYHGRSKVSESYRGKNRPDLTDIRDSFTGPTAVCLQLGYYKDAGQNSFVRTGGHFVTLVGYGIDEKGHADPDVLIIHDPGNVKRGDSGNQYLHLTKCTDGTLNATSTPDSAEGFYRVKSGIYTTADACFLEGYVVMSLEQ